MLDDFADLVRSEHGGAARDAVASIARLGRAVGVHLVLVAQHAGPTVLPDAVMSNVPSRLVFATAESSGSIFALGKSGAERLPIGEALWRPLGAGAAVRIRGAAVPDRDIDAVVAHCREQLQAHHSSPADRAGAQAPQDAIPVGLLVQCAELIVATQFGSTSMLQRKLRLEFATAGRVMDELERLGVVASAVGTRARGVLVRPEDLPALLRRLGG